VLSRLHRLVRSDGARHAWGLADESAPDDGDLALLDRVAEATAVRDPNLAEVRRLYDARPRLRVPPTVVSYSPLTGEPRQVSLRS
jgi:hypothetical protein